MIRTARRLVVLALLLLPARIEAADRVVSLNLCTDQLLVLLAPEKIVALSPLSRDAALSFVAARAVDYPVVRASAEAVMRLQPDLVLGGRFGARTTLALLEQESIRVERLDMPDDFPGIRAMLRATAGLLGVPDRAEPVITAMDARLPPPPELPPLGPPRTALAWQARGWTSGPGQLMDSILRVAGLINIGSGARLGTEALLRHPPMLLVLPDSSSGPSLATAMFQQPVIASIPIQRIPLAWTICPGPFVAEAVAALVDGG